MRLVHFGAMAALAMVLCTAAQASDPTAVYSRIDRVVLGPDAENPETIQIWGVFTLAAPEFGRYQPAVRGYLYFTLKNGDKMARAEFRDLKAAAGTGQIVAFGRRYELKPRVRPASEKAADPDLYVTNVGVVRIAGVKADYPPIQSLLKFKD